MHSLGFCVAVVCLAVPLLHAGEIRLQVNDPSGSGMPATGKLRSLTNGVERGFRTDNRGVRYQHPSLSLDLDVARGWQISTRGSWIRSSSYNESSFAVSLTRTGLGFGR